MANHWWIVIGAAEICVLGPLALIVRSYAKEIARNQAELKRAEIAVVRPAAEWGFLGFGPSKWLTYAFIGGPLGLLGLALWCFAYYKHRAAVKKVVGFDPSQRNRMEGVIFWFYELRITRTELIKGYSDNAQRTPLRGLTASVTRTDTVDITIEGPDTNFVYTMPYDALAGFNISGARQFAALLNYEARLQDAPR